MDWETYASRAEEVKTKLYRTALMYLGDASAAEEALDETLYKGLLACGRLREASYFQTWITRILLNVCADEQRRKGRLLHLEELPETAQEAFDALPLRDAVSRLPKDLKSVVILRFFAGCTLAETAGILNIPQGTAATRQRKALALLKMEVDS